MLRVVWALHCSRKRGPLSGAGFLCARDEASFLAICQAAPPLVAATVTTTTTAAPAVCFLPGIQYCFSAFTLFPSSPFLRSFIIFLKISNPLVLVCIASYQKRFRGKVRIAVSIVLLQGFITRRTRSYTTNGNDINIRIIIGLLLLLLSYDMT